MGQVAILGAGCAGLAAAYELKQKNIESVVYEKNSEYGGLCRSFTIDGFTFDTFAHVNFSKDPYVMSMLEEKTEYLVHRPEAVNYYHGAWVRNPAQNNLVDLPIEERISVIEGFVNRDIDRQVQNYEDWLRVQYGDYFTEHFPAAYTRKYWTVEPEELETKWVEGRMYTPTLAEVLRGSMTKETPNVHYTKEIHYPREGGYGAFLRPFAEHVDICCNKKVVYLNPSDKIIRFSDGEEISYDKVISTIPMNELVSSMEHVPEEIQKAADNLEYTSGVIVSIGLNCENVSPELWFYIYDEDIHPARVYAPNIKSPANVPRGCCALQAEVYFSRRKPLAKSIEEIREETVQQLINMGLFSREDILVVDARMEEYANIMFTPKIYEAREKVRTYLENQGIICAGRFGEWDYLWTGQSLVSGRKAARQIEEDFCYNRELKEQYDLLRDQIIQFMEQGKIEAAVQCCKQYDDAKVMNSDLSILKKIISVCAVEEQLYRGECRTWKKGEAYQTVQERYQQAKFLLWDAEHGKNMGKERLLEALRQGQYSIPLVITVGIHNTFHFVELLSMFAESVKLKRNIEELLYLEMIAKHVPMGETISFDKIREEMQEQEIAEIEEMCRNFARLRREELPAYRERINHFLWEGDRKGLSELLSSKEFYRKFETVTDMVYMILVNQIYWEEVEEHAERTVLDGRNSIDEIMAFFREIRFKIWRLEFEMDEEAGRQFIEFVRENQISGCMLKSAVYMAGMNKVKLLMRLSMLFLDNNMMAKAFIMLKYASELSPGNEDILCTMADLCLKMGKKQEALYCLEQVEQPTQITNKLRKLCEE